MHAAACFRAWMGIGPPPVSLFLHNLLSALLLALAELRLRPLVYVAK